MSIWSFHRRVISRLAAVFVVAMVVAQPTVAWAAAPGEVVGAVIRVQGEAISVSAGRAPVPLSMDAAVRFGEQISTGRDARILVRLLDGTEIVLGENGSLFIDDFVYDPTHEQAGAAFRIVTGAFRAVTGAIAKSRPQAMTFQTPVATIGIRGTELWAGPIDDVYGVLLETGQIQVRNGAGTVELGPGQGTTLTSADQPPSIPVNWSEGRKAKAAASVAFR